MYKRQPAGTTATAPDGSPAATDPAAVEGATAEAGTGTTVEGSGSGAATATAEGTDGELASSDGGSSGSSAGIVLAVVGALVVLGVGGGLVVARARRAPGTDEPVS